MSVFVVAELRALPGQEDRLLAILQGLVEPSLAEPGCLAYRPYVDPSDPARVAMIEEYADAAAIDAHFTTAHFQQAGKDFQGVLAEPPVIRRLVAG
ncbi:putative quinol monooxygenase [Nocardia sp. NPDC055321]